MKRFFAALLTLTCMLSLSACREEQAAAKPVIYLYPEEETAVTVKPVSSTHLTLPTSDLV